MSYTRSKSAAKRRRKRTSGLHGKGSRGSSAIDRDASDDPIEFTPSSGNVFLDLGYSPAEAESMAMRSALMVRVIKEIKRRRLTQAKAAKLFGISQPRISDLVRGKFNLFSLDSLVVMLTHAGMRVRLSVKPAA